VIELSFDLHPLFWGKGLGFEAAQPCVAYAQNDELLVAWQRIEALTLPRNFKARSLLTRPGFGDAGLDLCVRKWKSDSAQVQRHVLYSRTGRTHSVIRADRFERCGTAFAVAREDGRMLRTLWRRRMNWSNIGPQDSR
jgi:hypothetical protein